MKWASWAPPRLQIIGSPRGAAEKKNLRQNRSAGRLFLSGQNRGGLSGNPITRFATNAAKFNNTRGDSAVVCSLCLSH